MARFNIDDELKLHLMDAKDIILAKGYEYSTLEQHAIYGLYNRVYGTQKEPNGCPSCLSSTLAGLRRAIRFCETYKK